MFFLSRLFQAILALLVLSIVVFAMSRATGDPLNLLLPAEATQEDFVRVGKALGLDRPLPVQYGIFLRNAIQGDLGRSHRSAEKVTTLLWERVRASAGLGVAAIVITLVIGLPLGVLSAVRRGTPLDTMAKFVAVLGQSMPSFWVGIVLIQVFSVWLGWLPSGTNQGPVHVILPAVTLALYGVSGVARLLRSSMLEVLNSEFVKLARAKGVSENWVIWKHALKNAMLPVVSFSGVFFVTLITLSIVVEVVFAWPGMGQLTFSGILNRDFPVVQGVVLLAGAMSIFVNLFTDVLYTYLDPRIRYASH